VTLLDTTALLGLLRGDPAEAEVKALLRRGGCVTPSTCLAELVDQLTRVGGIAPEEVADCLDPLIGASLGIVSIENRLGWQAGQDRALHYERNSTDLSLADCVLLACTGPEDELASSDGALLRTARELDLRVIALPDSRGQRPG
jgi:predicted nucleic acid-binding protein